MTVESIKARGSRKEYTFSRSRLHFAVSKFIENILAGRKVRARAQDNVGERNSERDVQPKDIPNVVSKVIETASWWETVRGSE